MKSKTFLIAGLGLMTAAAVYGFVDYNKTRHSKSFTTMYQETGTVPVVEKAEEPAAVSAAQTAEVKLNAAKTTTAIVKEKKTVKKVKAKKASVVAVKEKPRKLDLRMFSRAPLRDIPVEKMEPEKTVTIIKDKPNPEN